MNGFLWRIESFNEKSPAQGMGGALLKSSLHRSQIHFAAAMAAWAAARRAIGTRNGEQLT